MGVTSRPEAIREMLKDEVILENVPKYRDAGAISVHPVIYDLITEVPSHRRLTFVTELLGINSEASKDALQGASQRLNELKQLLNAVGVMQQKTGVNINQIAKQLNTAAHGDADNVTVWNWALKQLQGLNDTNKQLQQDLKKLEKHLFITESKGKS